MKFTCRTGCARLAQFAVVVLWSCTPAGDHAPGDVTDAAALPRLFEDCTPGKAEAPCQAGLRCGLVRVGAAPYLGWLTQCVPVVASSLPEEAPCIFDAQTAQPEGAQPKRFDRCAAGLGCVPLPAGEQRCRSLCPLRIAGACGAERLCVLPSPVSAVGFCAAPDGCDPLAQTGCARGPSGGVPGCYVLADKERAATYCLTQDLLGDSAGDSGSPCDRSANCKPLLSCVTLSPQATCRPYCPLPRADGGTGPAFCDEGQGTCHPINGYDGLAGRCY